MNQLRKLGVYENNIQEFEEKGTIFSSMPSDGALYWADKKQIRLAREFEEETNSLVYMIVRSYTMIGRMDCLLYVSDYPEEWEQDRESLERPADGVLAYVHNYDAPECSEFGDVGLERTPAEGLVRIW